MAATRFCCGRLETGLIIWGSLTAMCNTLTFVSSLLIYLDPPMPGTIDTYYFDTNMITLSYSQTLNVTMAMSLVGIVTSALLIAGIVKENSYMMLPYMLNAGALVLLMFIVVLPMVLPTLVVCAPLGFGCYLSYCVYCLYEKFNNKERRLSYDAFQNIAPPSNV